MDEENINKPMSVVGVLGLNVPADSKNLMEDVQTLNSTKVTTTTPDSYNKTHTMVTTLNQNGITVLW